ncbi:MAG: 4-hydroxythreonine-4-phosphate dehydrogenase PdxA [Kiloniellales bacterium]
MTGGERPGGAPPPLACTMGEPAGIGAELLLKAWLSSRGVGPRFFALDDPARLEHLARRLDLAVPIAPIAAPQEADAAFDSALPVLPVSLPIPVEPGRPDPRNAGAVLASIERAVELVQNGAATGLVTNPINKALLYQAGFRHPGHTEYLAELAGLPPESAVMMLAAPELRVVPVTVHLPLKEAVARLSSASIFHAGWVTAEALVRDFGIARPRLAVAGLNPHAGEGGALGLEEATIIAPALTQLREQGGDLGDLEVIGPVAADSLFHAAARQGYDAVLCMYHDQALIPLKTLAFSHGVNVTLGLPFVRTSPDHGTAFDIAGRGIADPRSFMAALALAREMAAARARHERALA